MRKFIIIAVLGGALLLAAGCSGGGGDSPKALPGSAAPEFELQGLDGTAVSVSGLQGSPVMLNFWATWCPPCRGELPIIQQAYEDPAWKGYGVKILAVDIGESPDEVQDFMNGMGFNFPVLLDRQQEVAKYYNVAAIPTTFFIDKDGIIKYVKKGAFTSDSELQGLLGSLVSGTD